MVVLLLNGSLTIDGAPLPIRLARLNTVGLVIHGSLNLHGVDLV
jgi:hypothetical protein